MIVRGHYIDPRYGPSPLLHNAKRRMNFGRWPMDGHFWLAAPPQGARVHCLLNALRTCSRYECASTVADSFMSISFRIALLWLSSFWPHCIGGKKAVQLLKPLRLGKRHSSMGRKSLPMVRHEDGSVVHSREEAVNRWRRHFSQIEGGITTDPDRLWHAYEASHTVPNDPCI